MADEQYERPTHRPTPFHTIGSAGTLVLILFLIMIFSPFMWALRRMLSEING